MSTVISGTSAPTAPTGSAAGGDLSMARTRRLGWGLRTWVGLVVVVLLAPTLIVIPMSFGTSQTFVFPPRGFTLHWYQNFFTSADWTAALVNSFEVAVIAAPLATVLGVAAAVGLHRSGFRGRGQMQSLMLAPMIVPGVLVAIAIYALFLRWHLTGQLPGFVLAHTVVGLPFVIVSMNSRLAGYNRDLERAASSLGANEWHVLRRVTLPLLLPGILTGLVLAFVASIDEVVISLFLYSPGFETLPVHMYRAIVFGIDPTIAAASTLLIVVTTLALTLIHVGMRRKDRP